MRGHVHLALRVDPLRKNVVDRDIIGSHLARRGLARRGQPGAGSGGQTHDRERRLHHLGGYVDYPAELPAPHTAYHPPAAFVDRDIVCSSLPDTAAVERPGGIFDAVAPGTVCVDLSTISVATSQALAEAGGKRGIGFLDAPVSGTSTHAAAGTLAVMVGGGASDLERVRPVLECFSASVDHVGPNGAGLLLKLATNRLLTVHLAAIAEAVVEMETAGLDVAQGLDILRRGAVPRLLDYKAAPLAERDFTPLFTP